LTTRTVSGCSFAYLAATRLRSARRATERATSRSAPALTRDDELLGDLCASAPLFEGVVDELQVILAHHIVLLRHRQVAHDAVQEPLQPDQEPTDILIRVGSGQAEERARLVQVADHDYPWVVLANPFRPEQCRRPVVAPRLSRPAGCYLAHSKGLLFSSGCMGKVARPIAQRKPRELQSYERR